MGTATLYAVENGKPRVLTVISGVANSVRYSPDGSRIALLATVGAHKMTGAIEAGAAQVGEIGESNDEQRIAVLPAKGGALKLVSPADTYVYEFDWAPRQGSSSRPRKAMATTIGGSRRSDSSSESGAMRNIAAPMMQIELPRVSPDGKTVAFIGGLMSDWQSIGGDVYTVPVAGGAPRNLTPEFKGSFRSIDWRGGKIVTGAIVDDRFAVGVGRSGNRHGDDLDGALRSSVRTQGVNSAVAFSADGNVAALIMEDFNHAFEIALGNPSNLAPITDDNAKLAQNVSVTKRPLDQRGLQSPGLAGRAEDD